MEAIDFLKNKGITKATCYTDGGGTYYVSELAKLMEEYAALRQPPVSGSLPFSDGFVEGEGYCDADCKAVVWENDLCIYRDECPIGCGTVWVLQGNDR